MQSKAHPKGNLKWISLALAIVLLAGLAVWVFQKPEDPPQSGMSSKAVPGTRGFGSSAEESLAPVYFTDGCHDEAQRPMTEMTPESRQTLRANADWLTAHPEISVELGAHCDERGSNNYVLAKAGRRSEYVKKELVRLGVDSSRLHTISYGQEKPACAESSDTCWARNNRVDFVILRE